MKITATTIEFSMNDATLYASIVDKCNAHLEAGGPIFSGFRMVIDENDAYEEPRYGATKHRADILNVSQDELIYHLIDFATEAGLHVKEMTNEEFNFYISLSVGLIFVYQRWPWGYDGDEWIEDLHREMRERWNTINRGDEQ